jgi:TatD DNase family protein
VITFKNANPLKDAVKVVPPHLLLSETDAPWLTPVPYRGQTNSPLYISYVVKEMAKILNVNEEKLAQQIYDNAARLFNKF